MSKLDGSIGRCNGISGCGIAFLSLRFRLSSTPEFAAAYWIIQQPRVGLCIGGRGLDRANRRHLRDLSGQLSGAGRLLGPALGLSVAFAASLPVAAALAQSSLAPFPGQAEPGRNTSAPAPSPTPQFDFSIPAPQRGPVPRAVDEIEFDVTDIKVVGATVFPPEAFKPLDRSARRPQGEAVRRHRRGRQDRGDVSRRRLRADARLRSAADRVERRFQINVVEGFVKADRGDRRRRPGARAGRGLSRAGHTAAAGDARHAWSAACCSPTTCPGTAQPGLLRPSPTEPGASDLVVNLVAAALGGNGLYRQSRRRRSTGAWTLGAQFVANTLLRRPRPVHVRCLRHARFRRAQAVPGALTRPVGYDGVMLSLTGVLSRMAFRPLLGGASSATATPSARGSAIR